MNDSVLVLNNEAVESVWDVESCLKTLEDAYRAQAAGKTILRQRTQTYVPLEDPETFYCLKTMDGALLDGEYMTLRITSDIVSEAKTNGVARREKLPRGPGDTYCGLILLFSLRHLTPVAIIQDGYIQMYRVACTSALSARLLARENAGDLALFGSGGQAWAHLVAMNAVSSLRRVRIYSPTRENRESFARRARSELGIAVDPADSPRDAIDGADHLVLATNSNQPIIDGTWLAPGAHVVSIVSGDDKTPRREIDDETVRRAACVIAHSKEAAQAQKQGDLWEPVEAGILSWEDISELWEVVAGIASGRSSEDDITLFKNNIGTGLQFAAVAPQVYERARAANLGQKLPAEWFVQKMKP